MTRRLGSPICVRVFLAFQNQGKVDRICEKQFWHFSSKLDGFQFFDKQRWRIRRRAKLKILDLENKMADMFWIHCNRCLTLFVEVSAKNGLFYVTNCGHVYCQDCAKRCCDVSSGQRTKCFVCNKTDVRPMPMDKNLRPDVKDYFTSIPALIKALYTAADFQNTQLRNFITKGYQNLKNMNEQCR